MSDAVIHDLRSEDHIEAIRRVKEYLGSQTGAIGLRLTNNLAIIGISSLFEKNGWLSHTYKAGNDHLVLGTPPDHPSLTVWYGQGGWKVRRGDDESSNNQPDPLARLMTEVKSGQQQSEPMGGARPEAKTSGKMTDTVAMTAIIVSSDSMGQGNADVGMKLIMTYFDTLTAMASPPEIIFFYNSGANLTTKESPVLSAIKDLALQGTNVLTCSICLDHYQLSDQLKVGRKSNMYELISIINTYGNVIYL